jgi:cytochrome P450
MPPRDPIAAVTHPDPYPYYADLVADRPLYRDEAIGMWIATGAAAVSAVLADEYCRVRPPLEPVPTALLGSPAADIFRHLVRMNDGQGHCPFKQAITATLGALDPATVAEQSRVWARFLEDESMRSDPARLVDFAFQLPVYVVATLLGAPRDRLRDTSSWVDDFTRCLAQPVDPELRERGNTAARGLLDLFRSLLSTPRAGEDAGLLGLLAKEARRVGRDDIDAIVANGIGFLTQAYEATAGLICNTLVALARQGAVREQVSRDPSLLHLVIPEVLRHDSPIQNTRRFLGEDALVAGQRMKKGDAVLVVLAAANRDPLANPDPHRFDIFRQNRRIFTFGAAAHACPGEQLALTIAEAGVVRLLASGLDTVALARTVSYRPSVNARIPSFAR